MWRGVWREDGEAALPLVLGVNFAGKPGGSLELLFVLLVSVTFCFRIKVVYLGGCMFFSSSSLGLL